jgi:molybdopterin-guanine dinucleotide biosynthesis protein A
MKVDFPVTALILAGGQSSRMGQDKALIALQGVPLLSRICQIAQACTPQVYIITPWPAKYQAIVPENCQFISEVRLENASGALIGFAQGLAQIKTDWVLLLACDLPYLRADILQAGIAQLPEITEKAIAFLPRSAKGWEPLCGFYRRRCLEQLNQFIAGGGRSFQLWLGQNAAQELTITDAQMLFNCNTPKDLEIVQRLD